MTLDELRHRMTQRELRVWIEAYAVEPWGEDRADLRAGIIASTVANCNRSKGASFKPSDFMPQFEKPVKKQMTGEEMRAMAFKANALMGGTVVNRKSGER